MSFVKILRETKDTVTIRRDDWQRLRQQLDDASDLAAAAQRRAREDRVGKEAARRDYLTAEEATELLDGEHPIKVWRKKRGLSQRALAEAVGVANSYLAEIEIGRKRGSDDAYRKLGAALRVPVEQLDPRLYRARDPQNGPVKLRLNATSAGASAGNRGAWADPQRFDNLGEALEFVRDNWASLQARAPWIADEKNLPIYNSEELIGEIEG